jgi:WD40 repeat protein
MMASGSLDQQVKIWNAEAMEEILTLEGHTGNIYSLVFSPDNRYLVSGSRDQTIRVWEVATGEVIRTLRGHKNAVFSVRFTPDEKHLVSASFDGIIKIWDLTTGLCIKTVDAHKKSVNDLEWIPGRNGLLSASSDHKIKQWNLDERFFVDYYYREDIEKDKEMSGLFGPRKPEEDKSAYRERMEKAAAFEDKLYADYFVKFKEMTEYKKIREEK